MADTPANTGVPEGWQTFLMQAAYVIKGDDKALNREPHPLLRIIDGMLSAAPQPPSRETAGQKILRGLEDAVKANFSRVTINGQTWVRHDAGSPEVLLSQTRDTVVDLYARNDSLSADLVEARKALADLLREAIDHENPWGADHVAQVNDVVCRARAALSPKKDTDNGLR